MKCTKLRLITVKILDIHFSNNRKIAMGNVKLDIRRKNK